MHIDAHQHFWIYEPREYAWIDESMTALRRNFLPSDLEPDLKENGFGGCIAVQARQTVGETRWLLELAASCPFIVGVVGWVDLCSPHVRTTLALFAKYPHFVGVRHVVQSEPDDRFLLREEFLRGVAALEEFDLTYDILIYPKHLAVAAEFVSRFERQRFVLDHLAKPAIKSGDLAAWEAGIQKLAAFPNVYCKLSGMVTEADWVHWKEEQLYACLDVVFGCFGPQRLMIGSDWPVCKVASSYKRTMAVVKDYLARHAPAAHEAVLGGNAVKFWKLDSRLSLRGQP